MSAEHLGQHARKSMRSFAKQASNDLARCIPGVRCIVGPRLEFFTGHLNQLLQTDRTHSLSPPPELVSCHSIRIHGATPEWRYPRP